MEGRGPLYDLLKGNLLGKLKTSNSGRVGESNIGRYLGTVYNMRERGYFQKKSLQQRGEYLVASLRIGL